MKKLKYWPWIAYYYNDMTNRWSHSHSHSHSSTARHAPYEMHRNTPHRPCSLQKYHSLFIQTLSRVLHCCTSPTVAVCQGVQSVGVTGGIHHNVHHSSTCWCQSWHVYGEVTGSRREFSLSLHILLLLTIPLILNLSFSLLFTLILYLFTPCPNTQLAFILYHTASYTLHPFLLPLQILSPYLQSSNVS